MLTNKACLLPDIIACASRRVRKVHTHRFYEDIRKEYKRLLDIKKGGVRVYSDEYILAELSRKFYRSPSTIQNILFGRV